MDGSGGPPPKSLVFTGVGLGRAGVGPQRDEMAELIGVQVEDLRDVCAFTGWSDQFQPGTSLMANALSFTGQNCAAPDPHRSVGGAVLGGVRHDCF